ncbi:hypothetical protein MHU86_4953 [Fragilaria crotonensis]|nr:hypothetical protein MHU86_4953 [Fragilaria crotonensis]
MPQQHEQTPHVRKQGITMEDLKKQTALRLAQEQQQTEFFPALTQQAKSGPGALGGGAPCSHAILPGPSRPPLEQAFPLSEAPRNNYYQQESTRNNYRSSRNPLKLSESHASVEMAVPPQPQPVVVYPGRTQAQTQRNGSFTAEPSNDCKSKLPHGLTVKELKEMTKMVYPRPQASTLPRGLTVKELKEMTKARLDEQRRRSLPKSKKKQHYQQHQPVRHEVSHDMRENQYHLDLPQQRGPPVTNNGNHGLVQERVLASPSHGYAPERVLASPSHGYAPERVLASPSHGYAPERVLPPPSQGYAPQLVLASPSRGYAPDRVLSSPSHCYAPDRMLSSPSHALAGPPGFQSLSTQGSLVSGLDTSQVHSCGRDGSWQHAKDAWESGSVASLNSTINSEFLGSECNLDELGEIQFHRTRSYPGGPGIGVPDRQYEGSLAISGYYDPGLTPNQNRRRAATLSPRLGLSYLQEDRPVFPSITGLSMPLDSSAHSPIPIRLSPQPHRNRIYSDNGAIGGDFGFNRPRTASAPTVSSFFAMTGEMFGDVCGGLSSLSAAGDDPQRYQSNSELPNSMVESILDESSSVAPDSSDYSSVFRCSSQDAPHSALKNPWGAGVQNEPGSLDDAALALEFDSVLSLSGIDTPPAGYNQQQFPQTALFASLGGNNNNDSADQYHIHGLYGNPSSFVSADGSCRHGENNHGC